MNERIKELMEEAGLYDFVIESMGINEEMNKFAELIVRECMRITRDTPSMTETVEEQIGKHFGVEE